MKKLLFICSQNRLRSPTAAQVFSDHPGVETLSAGTNHDAETPLDADLVEWADLIELNKRKLGYLSSRLEVKNRSVKEKFEAEYGTIINEKVAARLTRSKVASH